MKLELTEAQVKVALREYIQKNHLYSQENRIVLDPWGKMSMKVNDQRLTSTILTFTK